LRKNTEIEIYTFKTKAKSWDFSRSNIQVCYLLLWPTTENQALSLQQPNNLTCFYKHFFPSWKYQVHSGPYCLPYHKPL